MKTKRLFSVTCLAAASILAAGTHALAEVFLLGFEKAEVAAWAPQVVDIDADTAEVYAVDLDYSRTWEHFFIKRSPFCTQGEYAMEDIIEGTRWGASWNGLCPHPEPLTDATYKDNAVKLSTHGWFDLALPKDWSGYDKLWLDIYSTAGVVKLRFGIEDELVEPYIERAFTVQPGAWYTLEIDLAQAVAERGLDLTKMCNLWTFVWETSVETTIYYDNLRLADAGETPAYTLLQDASSMILPAPPAPVPREDPGVTPDTGAFALAEPILIDLIPREMNDGYGNRMTFEGFGNPTYEFLWHGGISAFDKTNIAMMFMAGGEIGMLCTTDGGTTWTGLDGSQNPTIKRAHAHALGANADRGDILLIDSAGQLGYAGCGGDGFPTDRVWFETLKFKGDRWDFESQYLVTGDPRHCPYSPDVLRLPSGRIWATWNNAGRTQMTGKRTGTVGVHTAYSDDNGKTWVSWRYGKHGCISSLVSGTLTETGGGRLTPFGDHVACFWQQVTTPGYSSNPIQWSYFDGTGWSTPEVFAGTDYCGLSVVTRGTDEVFLAALTRAGIYRWDGGTWQMESVTGATSTCYLTVCGDTVLLFCLDGARINYWVRSSTGVWDGPQFLAEELSSIDTIAIPQYAPSNFVPVAWANNAEEWVKLLLLPMGSTAVEETALPEPIPAIPFPNPARQTAYIPYTIRTTGARNAGLRVYDLSGRLVRAIDLGSRETGLYAGREKAASWDGRDDSGRRMPSGTYLWGLEIDGTIRESGRVVYRH